MHKSCLFPSVTTFPAQRNQATNMEQRSRNNGIEEPPSWTETEKMLADAMAQLSVEERNSAMDDLHGIRRAELSARRGADTEKLNVMMDWMERHPNRAYQLAKDTQARHGPQSISVSDPEFQTYFLRSTDSEEPVDAAKKMLSFLEHKLDMFGEEALCRPVTLQDLSADDIDCLQDGFFQDLGKDSTGRQLVGCLPSQYRYKTVDSFIRASYYFMMTTFPERNHPDRHGVTVFYGNGMPPRQPDPVQDFQVVNRALTLTHVLPIKICATHITLDPNFVDPSVLFCIRLSKRKVRYKIHLGSHMEVQYELRRFGITGIPIDLQGRLSLHHHRRWIQHRQAMDGCLTETPKEPCEEYLKLETDKNNKGYIEGGMNHLHRLQREVLDHRSGPGRIHVTRVHDSCFRHECVRGGAAHFSAAAPAGLDGTTVAAETAITPTANDVLFGRGMYTQRHSGNIKFRAVLEKNLSFYVNAANDIEKIILVDTLCNQLVTKFGVRFLKQSSMPGSNAWVLQEDRRAIHAKFSQTFRSLNAAKNKKTQQQQHETR